MNGIHCVAGPRPLVLVIDGSRIFELSEPLARGVASGDPAAIARVHELDSPRAQRVASNTQLRALSLNVAQGCNMSCSYCYADEGRFGGQPRQMTIEVARQAIDRLLAERPERATIGFIGGEPMLNREVVHDAVMYGHRRARDHRINVGFSITTNATHLTAADIDLFRTNPFSVTVSMDGSREVHDRHRKLPRKSSHDVMTGCLAPLLAAPGRARVTARATVTRDDLAVHPRVASLLQAGFAEAGVSPVRSGPRPDLALHDADWDEYLASMIDAADREISRAIASADRLRFGNLASALQELHRGTTRALPCGAASSYVSVSAAGDWFTCHRAVDDSRFFLGTAETGPDAERRQAFVDTRNVDRQEPCRSCWARYLCGGGCHVEVIQSGRTGCSFIRGWLEYCIQIHARLQDEAPSVLAATLEE